MIHLDHKNVWRGCDLQFSIVSTMEGDGYALLLDAVTFEEIARVGFQRMYENAVLPLSSILKHDLSITPVHRYVFTYKCRNPIGSYDFTIPHHHGVDNQIYLEYVTNSAIIFDISITETVRKHTSIISFQARTKKTTSRGLTQSGFSNFLK